MGTGSFPGV